MRYVMIFGLVILAFFFHCGDAKAEAPDNIYFVTLDEVKAKMAAKEDFYLLTGRLDNSIILYVESQPPELSPYNGVKMVF